MSATKPSSGRRKAPQQARSREMVAKIVLATVSLLHEYPPEQLTTNLIAEKADISKGSIYQYFANKEQMIDAAIEQLAADQAPASRPGSGRSPSTSRNRRWKHRSTSSSTSRSPTAG